MAALSTSVPLDRVSATVGWGINATLEGVGLGFLPQNIGILASADASHESASASTLSFTSAKEVGLEYGFGSNAYAIARILRPSSGGKLGGMPTTILKVAKAAGGVAKVMNFTITGTATGAATHYLKVNGRTILDGKSYSFVVNKDDAAAEISVSMADALNNVLGCPLTGSVDVSDNFVATADAVGLYTDEYNIEVLTDDNSVGITYAEIAGTAGAGEPSVATALAAIGSTWVTQLVNGFGSTADILAAIEDFNGDANSKTGRYAGDIFKPLVSYFGDNTLTTLAGVTAVTDTPTGRKLEMTNVFCPAPNSKGTAAEAAANVAYIYAPLAQSTPNVDPVDTAYPDMPIDVDTDIGDFADSAKLDQIVKVGGSTVIKNGGLYQILDLVTTYHPDDEPVTSKLFRYVRDIVGVDFNWRYGYALLENIYVKGKTIVNSADQVSASGTISTIRWQGILASQYGPSLVSNALMADLKYFQKSIRVAIGETNSDRFETTFKGKRTSTARVNSTTVETTNQYG